MSGRRISVIKNDEPTTAALTRLFEEHNSSLVRLLRAKLRSDQEARDVAQEAYLRLLQLDQLDKVSYLRQYLFRTALNIATDRLRSNTVRDAAHRDPVFNRHSDEISPERTALAHEELKMVEAALNSLPAKIRYAFLLHRIHDLSVAEVAVRLGVTERTIRNYLVKALLSCHEALHATRPATAELEMKHED